jgi:hypothetical protein
MPVCSSALGIVGLAGLEYLVPACLWDRTHAELAPILVDYVPSVEAVALPYLAAGAIGVAVHVNQNLMSC